MTTFTGTSGNDTLSGGSGPDQLRGGLGNDRYLIDDAGDLIVEAADEGEDRIFASVSYRLRAGVFVETLSTVDLAGIAAINLTGNELANVLYGNAGANVLIGGDGNDAIRGYAGNDRIDGGAGIDAMAGGLGNDAFYVDDKADTVNEALGEGTDAVYASVSYALRRGVEVEALSTTSTAGTMAINLTGNEFANTISGNGGANVLAGGGGNDVLKGYAGNDKLDGGTGVDSMAGGLGDDSYYVDDGADVVNEAADAGIDRVFASTSYRLRAGVSVEALSTTGAAGTTAINLTGNEIDNAITGNAGANVLSGGAGDDTLKGGAGNDKLDGGTGLDTMAGGLGDDSYYVDAAGDRVSERAGEGNDRLLAGASYVLQRGASIETLSTQNVRGTAAIDLTGNEIDNAILGNAGSNVLKGGGGNDTLDGGAGADVLTGGAGADVFSFTAALGAGNIAVITDFEHGVDKIRLAGAAGETFAGLATGGVKGDFSASLRDESGGFGLLIYVAGSGALLYDADGHGSGAPIQFATVRGTTGFTWADFEVSGSPNTAPVISSGANASVAENLPAGRVVYQAAATDTDGDRIFWSLSGPDAAQLSIDRSGVVRLDEAADFETRSRYDFTVVASDSSGASSRRAVTLAVTDVVESTPRVAETTGLNDDYGHRQMIDLTRLEIQPNPNLPDATLPSVTIAGTISSPTDRDWYGIQLEAGQVLYLDVDNTSGNLDAMVSVYLAGGSTEVPILANDDLGVPDPGSDPHPEYGHNTDSFIRLRVNTAGIYYFAIEAFQDAERPTSGSYELNVSIGPPASAAELLEEDVMALLSGAQWDHTSLSYSFPTSTAQYPAGMTEFDEAGEFAPLNAAQQSAVKHHLAAIAAVSGLTFSAAANAAQADLRYAMTSDADTAFAYYPTNAGPDSPGGTAWFNRTYYNTPVSGDYAWLTFLHETGHALGLKHGHESPPISVGHDSLEYSVMTYRSYVGALVGPDGGFTNETYGFPTTLMMLDIAALQRMYGANFATNSGSTVYRWSPTTGEMSINGTGQGAPGANRVFMTLWDGGGTDTYDLSNYSTAVVVDLRPGEWTKTGAVQTANLGSGHDARGNIANALLFEDDPRSLIENAIGGSGNDTLIANQAANRLTGGAGKDTFQWEALTDATGLGTDAVVDFRSGVDKVNLARVDARTDQGGNNAFAFIGTGAFTHPADAHGELRYDVIGGALVLQGDVNADGIADFQIRFEGITSLAGSDFVL